MQVEGAEISFWRRREVLLLIVLGIAVPLAYVLYTKQIWEDYFITFRHGRNLCEGKGLVYNEGERVHGFTSPIGVLLPVLGYLVTGQHGYLPALWLFRIFCLAAFVGGGLLVLHRIGQATRSRWTLYAFVFLYTLEAKAVAFSINGMETGFMLLFVGWSIFLWDRSTPRTWLWRGLAWAGLMWTRPDGCVYIAVLLLTELFWTTLPRKELLRSFIRSLSVTTLVYLPWFLFAFIYYGSPVPQTIRAKMPTGVPTLSIGAFIDKTYHLMPHKAALAYAPVYFPFFWGEGPKWVWVFSYVTGVIALIYWLIPVNDRLGRAASFAFMLLTAYLSYMLLVFPWYLPPVALFTSVALSLGIVAMASGLARAVTAAGLLPFPAVSLANGTVGACFALLGAGMVALLGMTTKQFYVQEREIETGNRMAIGLWLKQNMRPGQTVFLEPIGYIGYFSDAVIRDWPGLVTPEVVDLRAHHVGFEEVPNFLHTDWVIYRLHEYQSVLKQNPQFQRDYTLVRQFDVRDRLEAYGPIPGGHYLVADAAFEVFKRRDSASDEPTATEARSSPGARLTSSP